MLKPIDIETKDFRKVALGYSTEEVDSFLDQILDDFNTLYTENIELQDKIGILNQSIDYYRSIEKTLQTTLILAEKTAEETKEAAEIRGKQIEKEAKLYAEELIKQSRNYLLELEEEIEKLKKRYELMRSRIKLLLYAEIELLDKDDIFSEIEKEQNKELQD